MRLRDLPARVRGWLRRRPVPALVATAFVAAAAIAAASYYAYGTYEYVQHDNDFCLSCHLMVDPYERFARSAHRDLGCKACHRPSLVQRSSMGLTQIIRNPDSLAVHAEVPNGVCAECHVGGDPEEWTNVAASAGHRIHLESTDSTLRGFRCVECHSTSVHEFASVDRTCARSGCHTESAISLGAMSALTIHCVACHSFSEPTPPGADPREVRATLEPDRDTCLSCHVMQRLVELPDPDPHGGSCASCHDPHTQATPAEAAESCTSAGCHESAEALTPFHVGIGGHATECMECHAAHDFALEGSDCIGCHTRILQDDPSATRPSASGVRDRAGMALHAEPSGFASWNEPLQETPTFRHSEHSSYDCAQCHSSRDRHGEVTVTTLADCRSCHHTRRAGRSCARCHGGAGPGGTDPVERTLSLPRGDVRRMLPFDHAVHAAQDCATCHTGGLALSAEEVRCDGCHQDHHDAERSCMACHEPAPAEAHPVARVHVTCGGSGCHTEPAFAPVPRTRQVCLGCHQDQVDHRPQERSCAGCHALPEPRPTRSVM